MPEEENVPEVDASADSRQNASDHGVGARSQRLTLLIIAVAVISALLDQVTKLIALRTLTPGADTAWFLGELLGWKLLFNPGAALSIGTGMTWVLTLIAVAVVVVVARIARRIGSVGWSLAFGLLLGGAVGNLIDRFFREPGFAEGHVVDFINYAGFFVGNVADIAIVAAAVLIAWFSIRGIEISGRQPELAQATDGAAREQTEEPAGEQGV